MVSKGLASSTKANDRGPRGEEFLCGTGLPETTSVLLTIFEAKFTFAAYLKTTLQTDQAQSTDCATSTCRNKLLIFSHVPHVGVCGQFQLDARTRRMGAAGENEPL